MPEQIAIKVCPMCNEMNQIEIEQAEFQCIRCGYKTKGENKTRQVEERWE